MRQPNVSEDLLEECCQEHPDDVAITRADSCKELDSSGIDSLLAFKIQVEHYPERVFFPMDLKLQVKTSDNLETVGVVLPVSDKFFAKKGPKISRKMHWRIKKHFKAHPRVTCMLFVSQLRDKKTREGIKAEIWRELLAIRHYIGRYYSKLLIVDSK